MNSTNITSEPSFSIITPTCNRASQLKRACESVVRQTYLHWEHIIVDDFSKNDVEPILDAMYPDGKVQYIRHKERTERVIAYNDGLKAVKNDMILFLDDDDEILPFTLEYLAEAIKKYPEYKIFNWGGLVTAKNKGWIRARDPVEFEEKIGCKCESGMIVNGQFMFHKSCLEKTGLFPEARNCYILADLAGIPGYDSKTRTLGNPWGQDFMIWYKLTRHYIPKKLDYYLYICHLRTTE
jgi:glycosyltransferase involved in cell wall biosynthesis